MKLKSITLLSLFVIACLFSNLRAEQIDKQPDNTVVTVTNEDYTLHTVVKGDTAYSLATTYKIAVADIYRVNPGSEKGLKVGSKLKIPKAQPTGYAGHIIKPQETLYGVSRQYLLSVEEITTANPGLSEGGFKTGKSIRIPLYGNSSSAKIVEHKVEKGENLYRISKAYNVTEEALLARNPSLNKGKLKQGMVLIIPNSKPAVSDAKAVVADNMIRIGVLLPFLETKGSVPQDKIVEYYEGLLLAVKEMKEKGMNAEIYTFDTGTEKDTKRLESILTTSEANNLNLIIGGTSKEHIDVLSKFAKNTGIKYVVPFVSQTSDVYANPNVFLVTNSHSNLYQNISDAFRNKYVDYNIVFVSEVGSDKSKADFVTVLKDELKKSNITFFTAGTSANLATDLKKVLSTTAPNVIITSSSSDVTLRKLTAALKTAKNPQVTLFGYPEWQTYSARASDLHQYDSHIFSMFYLDDQQYTSKVFAEQYRTWYNKNLINSYPKYACLGYDTGLYFLTAINSFGNYFESSLFSFNVATIQSSIHFKRVNNSGGYINNGFYFVHYKKDSTIEKIDCSR